MNNTSMKRRVLSIVLSVLMVMSIVPAAMFTASAANAPTVWEIWIDDQNTWWTNGSFSGIVTMPDSFKDPAGAGLDYVKVDPESDYVVTGLLQKDTSILTSSLDTWGTWQTCEVYTDNSDHHDHKLVADFNTFTYQIVGDSSYYVQCGGQNMTFKNGTAKSVRTAKPFVEARNGHMSFLDMTIVNDEGLSVKIGTDCTVDEIDGGAYGSETAAVVGFSNEGTISEIKAGTFYNLDNKGTIATISGGTFSYKNAVEGVNVDQIKDSVASDKILKIVDDSVYEVVANADIVEGTFYGKMPVAAEGSNVVDNQDGTYTVEAPVTYTVTFDGNGSDAGSVPADALVYENNNTYTLPEGCGDLAKTGYHFIGWGLSADATEAVTSVTVTDDITVYALWEADCAHENKTLVVDEEPGYYFPGVGHYVCDDCGETVEEDVEIEPKDICEKFTDVRGDWYKDAVAFSYDAEIVAGTTDSSFSPDNNMRRQDLVLILYRFCGKPEVTYDEIVFTDVPADAYYTDAVMWAYQAGIVNGVTATTFDPEGAVTREQFAAILYRGSFDEESGAAPAIPEEVTLERYADADKVADWAVDAIRFAVAYEVMDGYAEGGVQVMAPQGKATRAQIVTMLYRFTMNYLWGPEE